MNVSRIQRIDCHMHYKPTGFADHPAASRLPRTQRALGVPDSDGRPGWTDLAELREVMDGGGIDFGVILTFPHHATPFRRGGESVPDVMGRYNRALASDLEARGDDRFVMMAAVDPLSGPEGVAQLRRDLELPYVKGIALLTNYGDVTLDDGRFEPIFQLAAEQGVAVTVHPQAPGTWGEGARLDESTFLTAGLGYLLMDALCIFHMEHARVFERFPSVRFMFSQLGGVAGMCCARWQFHRLQALDQADQLNMAPPAWVARSLNDVLSHVWLDIHTQDHQGIRLVLEEAGAGSIVLGGDYPVSPLELGMNYMIDQLDALNVDGEVRQRIERDNALAFLGLQGA